MMVMASSSVLTLSISSLTFFAVSAVLILSTSLCRIKGAIMGLFLFLGRCIFLRIRI